MCGKRSNTGARIYATKSTSKIAFTAASSLNVNARTAGTLGTTAPRRPSGDLPARNETPHGTPLKPPPAGRPEGPGQDPGQDLSAEAPGPNAPSPPASR